jgi:hypothetical protein
MRPDSQVEPSIAVLNTQLQAATEAQRWLQTLQGKRYFIGLYLGDEAMQTTRTNFSEHTLNPSISPRSLSVEFEYTLYIYIYIYTHTHTFLGFSIPETNTQVALVAMPQQNVAHRVK